MDEIIEITCWHSGCNCGCTGRDTATWRGDKRGIYKDIAFWAKDYIARGKNPFYLLDIPCESEKVLAEYMLLKDKADDCHRQIEGRKVIIKHYKRSAENLKIDLPGHILLEEENLKRDIENFKKEKLKVEEEIRKVFAHNYEVERIWYDDD